MIRINFDLASPPPIALATAAEVLASGGVIICPTDTAYGFGASIFQQSAVRRVFELKNRPFHQPLSVFVSGFPQAQQLAVFTPATQALWFRLIPGPVTLILPKKNLVPDWLGKGCSTVGLRCPESAVIRQLTTQLPFTATSANLHGQTACYDLTQLEHQFGQQLSKVDLILDAGRLPLRPTSTVLDLSQSRPHLLRLGPSTKVQLERLVGQEISGE